MEKEIAQKHKNHLVKKTILRTVEKDDSLEIKLNAGEELIVKRIFEKGADGGYYDTLYVYLNGQEISALGQCSSLTIKLSKGDELIVQRALEKGADGGYYDVAYVYLNNETIWSK